VAGIALAFHAGLRHGKSFYGTVLVFIGEGAILKIAGQPTTVGNGLGGKILLVSG
jgi:hypothetical protein